MSIYVGNLSYDVTKDDLTTVFAEYGTVSRVSLPTDRETGRPRGFGFVEMASGGDDAINALNGKDHGGRSLNVNEARPREQRSRGGNRQNRY